MPWDEPSKKGMQEAFYLLHTFPAVPKLCTMHSVLTKAPWDILHFQGKQ